MPIEILLIAVGLMIFYDFSLHFLELIYGFKKASSLKYYWPSFAVTGKFSRRLYTRFWTVYWGFALFLIVVYLLSKF